MDTRTSSTAAKTRGLQLPNELLHQVLISSVADAIHAVGTTASCHWELNFLVTFYCVSLSFRAIAKEIVCKAFDVDSRSYDGDEMRYVSVECLRS